MAELRNVELLFNLKIDDTLTWTKVDIDQNTAFSFNLQASDITEPTATKIPFSFQISLPKTRTNDFIFSNIGKVDSTLVNMNAIERTEFRMFINNNLYQEGYFKLEDVNVKNYKIRLYGGLGDYFYELSDTSEGNENDMYMKNLEFGTDFNHTVDRSNVEETWNLASLPSSGLNSFFGYAMTYQGQYDNFDSDTVVNGSSEDDVVEATWSSATDAKSYSSPVLNEHRRNVKVGSTVYCGDYVSYYQRPMIRLQKLFDKILERMTKRGWTTVKDTTFFNPSNPYWNDVWCILPQYSTDGTPSGTELKIGDLFTTSNPSSSSPVTGNWNRNGAGHQTASGGKDKYPQTAILFTSADCPTACNIGAGYENTNLQGGTGLPPLSASLNQTYTLTISRDVMPLDNTKTNNITVSLPFYLRWVGGVGNHTNRRHKSKGSPTNNTMSISAQLKVGNMEPKTIEAAGETGRADFKFNDSTCQRMNHMRNYGWYASASGDEYNTNAPDTYIFQGTFSIPAGNFTAGSTVQIIFKITGDDRWWSNGGDTVRGMYPLIRLLKTGYINYSDSGGIGIRSGAEVTYNDIVQSDETCSAFLLSYCKTFGLYFVKDQVKKSVEIMTRNTYYGNQEKVDWTHRIDHSKDIVDEIAKFDYKIGLFKWRDSDSKYETEYLDKYSREYGSLRVNNQYGFSDAENDYFKDNIFSNCVIATAYDQYFLGRNNTLYKDNKTLPFLQDSAGEGITANFILVFRQFPASTVGEEANQFLISDDNEFMLTYGYSWNGMTTPRKPSRLYPNLRRTISKDGDPYSLYFGSPAAVYNDDEGSGSNNSTDGEGTIYNRFWAKFLGDRFDKDTRKRTCYVDLTINDIQQDLFRKFIYIEDTVWVLNKIIGFNPLDMNTTKVELIKVKDINNYLGQKYIAGEFKIYYPRVGQPGSEAIYDSESNAGQPSITLDSSRQTIQITLDQSASLTGQGWTINAVDGLTITPTSSKSLQTTVSITVPENGTGKVVYYSIPIRWGNTTTVLQITQVSNWTVTTSTDPASGGTTNASGGGESGTTIDVADGTSVTLTVTPAAGYSLLYWEINGEINNNISPVISVNNDINAVAYLYDESAYVKVNTVDENTVVTTASGTTMTRYDGYYWLLQTGVEYTFTNNREDISGYSFSDGVIQNPAASFTRSFSAEDTLTVYYDTLIVNLNVINNSSQPFNSTNVLFFSPSGGVLPSPTGTVPAGETRSIVYTRANAVEGTYTIEATEPTRITVDVSPDSIAYTTGMNIPTVTITVEDEFFPELEIDPTTKEVSANVNQYTIEVKSNTTWEIYINPIYDAYVYATPLNGNGDATVNISISANPSGAERTGIMEFRTTYGDNDLVSNHVVTQRPLEGTLHVSLINTTGAVITPATPIVGQIKRGTTIVEQFDIINVPTGTTKYEFEVAEGDYVVELSSYTGATASGTYSILPDESQSIGVIGGQTTGVTYGVGSEDSRILVLTPEAVAVGALLNNFTLQVVATDGLSWSITDNANWLSCSPTTGTGSATITVTVAANLLGNRQGRITVTSTNGTPTLTDFCDVSQTGIL